MNFALLGPDEDVLTLARALAANHEHRIVAICEPGEHAAALRSLAPQARVDVQWESLLLETIVDAVIVGRSAPVDVRADQLRKLVQAKVPLLVVHPSVEAIVGYEIEMIRRDVGGIVVPYWPGVRSDVCDELKSHANGEMLGPVEQLVFERPQADRSRTAALAQLARDTAIIRDVLGAVKTVSASGNLSGEGPSNLSVQMTTDTGRLARWAMEPASSDAVATMTLFGAKGKVTRDIGAGTAERQSEAERFLNEFIRMLSGGEATLPAWLDACRASEVADTVPRCLARGKTIELYNEEHTEEGAFKGVMAVGGCLILMIGLLLVIFVAMVEGLQLPLHRFALWNNWPLYICAAFFFFLLLQLFRFAARGR